MIGGRLARTRKAQLNSAAGIEPVFDSEFRTRLSRNYAGLPEWSLPPVVFAAISEASAEYRAWLDAMVAGISAVRRSEVISRLRSEEHIQTVAELQVAETLSRSGATVALGPLIGGMTPDLEVVDQQGRRTILEVWTRSVPPTLRRQRLQWGELARWLERIPVAALLAVDSEDRGAGQPPNPAEVKVIAQSIRSWLTSARPRLNETRTYAGYRFIVVGASFGESTELVPPLPSAHTDSQHVWEAIRGKVQHYRHMLEAEQVPFAVVLCAEAGSGLSRDGVAAALAGSMTLTFAFGLGTFGSMDGRNMELRRGSQPPKNDPCLSAVGWLETESSVSPRLSLWSVRTARHALQVAESGDVVVLNDPSVQVD